MYRNLTEKDKIFFDVWKCAYKRMQDYSNTSRYNGEYETVSMCLNIAKWWEFEEERNKFS